MCRAQRARPRLRSGQLPGGERAEEVADEHVERRRGGGADERGDGTAVATSLGHLDLTHAEDALCLWAVARFGRLDPAATQLPGKRSPPVDRPCTGAEQDEPHLPPSRPSRRPAHDGLPRWGSSAARASRSDRNGALVVGARRRMDGVARAGCRRRRKLVDFSLGEKGVEPLPPDAVAATDRPDGAQLSRCDPPVNPARGHVQLARHIGDGQERVHFTRHHAAERKTEMATADQGTGRAPGRLEAPAAGPFGRDRPRARSDGAREPTAFPAETCALAPITGGQGVGGSNPLAPTEPGSFSSRALSVLWSRAVR